jgi:TonB family protein
MQVLGHYQVLEEIGRGGMGVVYRGLDTAIGRTVAIKTIAAAQVPDEYERQQLRERLAREARSAGILSHPAIVTIYHFGSEGGDTYIVMEFVEGETLSARLRRSAFAPHETAAIVREMADALDYAHAQGVIHRDVKPSNIMIRPDGRVKITDFGIAKLLAHTATQTGTTVGSPHYMSPEQVQGKGIDGRADQYSLAILAFEMLTGQRPFEGDTITTLIFQIMFEQPSLDRIRQLPNGDSLAQVLARALQKSAAERYPTCLAFAGALAAAVRSPVRASAPAPRMETPPPRSPAVRGATPAPAPRSAAPSATKWLAGAGAAALVVAIAAGTVLLTSRSSDAEGEPPAPVSEPIPAAAVAPDPAPVPAAGSPVSLPVQRQPVDTKAASQTASRPKVESPPPPTIENKPIQPKPVAAKPSPMKPPPEMAPQPVASQPAEPKPEPKVEAAPPVPAQQVVEVKPEAKPELAPRIPPTQPVLLRRVSPGYTEDARREGVQGTVQLRIDIDEQGVPSNPRVLRSLYPSLDERAREAVVLWRFRPATSDGKPAATSVNVEVSFSLVGAPSRGAPSLKKR